MIDKTTETLLYGCGEAINCVDRMAWNIQSTGESAYHGMQNITQGVTSLPSRIGALYVQAKEKTVCVLHGIESTSRNALLCARNSMISCAERVSDFFYAHRHQFLYLGLSGVQAWISPKQFVIGTCSGLIGHFLITLFTSPPAFSKKENVTESESQYLYERGLECSIAQTTLLSVRAACEAARMAIHPAHYSGEGTVSSLFSGLLFGASTASFIRKRIDNALKNM